MPQAGRAALCMRSAGAALVPALEHFTGLELVHHAAVGALAFAVVADVDVDAWVVVPQLHVGLGVGAVNVACGVEVVGGQFYGGGGAHGGVSFWRDAVNPGILRRVRGCGAGRLGRGSWLPSA